MIDSFAKSAGTGPEYKRQSSSAKGYLSSTAATKSSNAKTVSIFWELCSDFSAVPDNIPCYRVVNAKGELAEAFAFGGAGAQAKLLEAEGVEVIDGKVDLKKYQMEEAAINDQKHGET